MSKHRYRYTATFKRKDETVFTKTFLASDCLKLMNMHYSMRLSETFSIST